MRDENRGMRSENTFCGIFLILAAVFLIVNKLGNFLQGVGLFNALFSVFWVYVLIEGISKRKFGKILFALAFLCIIYDKPLGLEAITPWTVLAAACLGTIGLNMIFKNKKHYHKRIWEHSYKNPIVDAEIVDEQQEGQNDHRVFFHNSFSSGVKYINTENFEYASLDCSFGSMKVYFDKAMIRNGSASIDLDVSFGSMVLYFPKEWYIINQVNTDFGSIEEKNENSSVGTPVVTLHGEVSFGAVIIIYV